MLAESGSAALKQSHPPEWHADRLSEARGIVADVAHHPDTLVLLACRVICAHSLDPFERVEALGLIRILATSTPNASPSRVGGAS
ncbi:hypothetical protein A9Q96_16910 [Rhodobacterales bacterium 52_120_T64]|nr:hypothetical protein A9Q96_16910 [Rhodobacterales bacterium 52_120_T64]